jgi:hypothetical protein
MREEMLTAGAARELLGISHNNMAKLIKDKVLIPEKDPLDRRLRLFRRSDIEQLAERSTLKKSAA